MTPVQSVLRTYCGARSRRRVAAAAAPRPSALLTFNMDSIGSLQLSIGDPFIPLVSAPHLPWARCSFTVESSCRSCSSSARCTSRCSGSTSGRGGFAVGGLCTVMAPDSLRIMESNESSCGAHRQAPQSRRLTTLALLETVRQVAFDVRLLLSDVGLSGSSTSSIPNASSHSSTSQRRKRAQGDTGEYSERGSLPCQREHTAGGRGSAVSSPPSPPWRWQAVANPWRTPWLLLPCSRP
jgi:hypothetical protein